MSALARARPWGGRACSVAVTWAYIAWALLPVGVAILFSFNAGRSRSVWQGFSLRWWTGDPTLSIFHDPDYSARARAQPHARRRSTW